MNTRESIAYSFSLILVYSWTIVLCMPWFHILGRKQLLYRLSDLALPQVGKRPLPHCVQAATCPASASSQVGGSSGSPEPVLELEGGLPLPVSLCLVLLQEGLTLIYLQVATFSSLESSLGQAC